MSLESSDTPHSTLAQANSVCEVACDASAASEQFGGKGWIELDEIANKLGWRLSRLTAVLRWLRQESPNYIVESKVSCGIVKVRITKGAIEAKQARQLSTEIISQLAKLYSNLKHSDRNREKLACDVRTIASRLAPFLENREFQIQYRRFKRQLVDTQQETRMEASVETPTPLISGDLGNTATKESPSRLDDVRVKGFDRSALRRLVLIGSIIVVGLIVTVFLATTFLHAMELLSQYVERINSQLNL